MKIGVLGGIVFEVSQLYVNSFSEIKRESTWKYAEHEIVKGKSRLQKLGRQLDTVTIAGRFVDYFCHPISEIKKMKTEAEKKEPLVLVVGDEVFGDFVIESINETWQETDGAGNPRVIEFEVQLKEYF
ncbi:MAG TPA: phage tail protein [Candidatus Hydrothermia bacterium]|nr:phage tail protein [Candidatus Hydrothermia bacterium]